MVHPDQTIMEKTLAKSQHLVKLRGVLYEPRYVFIIIYAYFLALQSLRRCYVSFKRSFNLENSLFDN